MFVSKHIWWVLWTNIQVFCIKFLAFSSFLGWNSKHEANAHPKRVENVDSNVWGSCEEEIVVPHPKHALRYWSEQVNTTAFNSFWQLLENKKQRSAKSQQGYLQPWIYLFWQNVYAASRNVVDYGNCGVHEDPQIINNDMLLVIPLFVIQHMKNNFPGRLRRATCKQSSKHQYLFLDME